jgi:hypothetical protein
MGAERVELIQLLFVHVKYLHQEVLRLKWIQRYLLPKKFSLPRISLHQLLHLDPSGRKHTHPDIV